MSKCIKDIDKTHSAIVLESNTRLIRVRRFNEDKFMFPHFIQDALSGSDYQVVYKAELRIHTMSFQAATMDSM
jgi:hypothetical protein